MTKHLETITLEFVEGTGAPTGGEGPEAPPNPCWHCLCGNHEKCTGVECYRCPREFHPRLPGLAATGEADDRKTVGRW